MKKQGVKGISWANWSSNPLSPAFASDRLIVFKGDAMSVLSAMPPGSADCIVTDFPYESLNRWRGIGTTTRLGGHRDEDKRTGWFETVSNEELYFYLCEFARLLPKNGHAWVMADGETMPLICGYVREGETGFDYCKPMPVIKLRADGEALKPGLGYHLRASHEYVVLCEKGRRRLSQESTADVFAVPWRGGAETKPDTLDGKPYPTAKPWMLMRSFIELSSAPGETILDPFAGGGATPYAALLTNRKAVSIDKSDYSTRTILSRCAAIIPGVYDHLPELRRDAVPVLNL